MAAKETEVYRTTQNLSQAKRRSQGLGFLLSEGCWWQWLSRSRAFDSLEATRTWLRGDPYNRQYI